jgi:hypothetical protein
MAATFLNLATGKSFRVVSTEEARDLAAVYAPEVSGKSQQQLTAYCRMPDSVLFRRSARPDSAQGHVPPVRAGRPRRACGGSRRRICLSAVHGGCLFFQRPRDHLGGHELGAGEQGNEQPTDAMGIGAFLFKFLVMRNIAGTVRKGFDSDMSDMQ